MWPVDKRQRSDKEERRSEGSERERRGGGERMRERGREGEQVCFSVREKK